MAEAEDREPLFTDDIRALLQLITERDIAEVHIKRGDSEVHIKRAQAQSQIVNMVAAAPHAAAPAPAAIQPAGQLPPAAAEDAHETLPSTGVMVTAPMVGTFYAAPSPKDPPYVRNGDEVRPGDVLGIVEAMKIMNEIECEIAGRIAEILVASGQPVEYGQPLMIIEPI